MLFDECNITVVRTCQVRVMYLLGTLLVHSLCTATHTCAQNLPLTVGWYPLGCISPTAWWRLGKPSQTQTTSWFYMRLRIIYPCSVLTIFNPRQYKHRVYVFYWLVIYKCLLIYGIGVMHVCSYVISICNEITECTASRVFKPSTSGLRTSTSGLRTSTSETVKSNKGISWVANFPMINIDDTSGIRGSFVISRRRCHETVAWLGSQMRRNLNRTVKKNHQ